MTISPAYIPDPSQTDLQAAARAAALSVGIAPRVVPPVYQAAVNGNTPGVVAEAAGQVVFLHDDGTKTSTDVTNLIAPLVAAQATQAAAAAAVVTASGNLQGIVSSLRTLATQASGTTATSGNVVNVVNVILADLAQLLNRLADLLVSSNLGN